MPMSVMATPPKKPSHVLLGEIDGHSLWRPVNEPTMYAPESLSQSITKIRSGRRCIGSKTMQQNGMPI